MINTIFLATLWFAVLFFILRMITKDTKKSVVFSGVVALVAFVQQVLTNQFSVHVPKFVYDIAIIVFLLVAISFFKKPR